MYFFFTTPDQLTGHERISPQRCEEVFAEFPLHIPALYGSTPYLLKNETVVVQVSVKHHRTTQCKLANLKPRFFHFIYHAFISIDLVTVFDAILTSRQTREKLQCFYETLMSNNFRRTAVMNKISIVN